MAEMYFTDVMTVTVKIDEPSGVRAKRGALVYKLRELADSIERGSLEVMESGGASNNDAGMLRYRIEPNFGPAPEEAPYTPPAPEPSSEPRAPREGRMTSWA